jgi:ABC-type Fe3+ transport system permease subunit
MPKLSIPKKLQELKANQLSRKRLLKGQDPDPDRDWEDAGRYFNKHQKQIYLWKFKEYKRKSWKILQFLGRLLILLICIPLSPFILLYYSFASIDYLKPLFVEEKSRSYAIEVVKTIIAALGFVATIVAGSGFVVNYFLAEQNTRLTEDRLTTTRQ